MGMTVISLIEIFINAALMIHEIVEVNKMRNSAVGANVDASRYEPLCEEKRRIRNYRMTAIVSIISTIAFVMIISIG